MTTSASTDFSVNRDDLIKASLRVLSVIDANETPEASIIQNAAQAMNMMMKLWSAEGAQMTIQKRATVFMQNSKTSYSLGPTGNHATHSYSTTTIKVAAAASATIVDFTTTTGMTAGDYIGVILTSGNVHWTTIASVTDSDTAVLTTGLATAAAAGNDVYWYTTKMYRPLDIIHAFIRNGNDDYTLKKETRDEYWMRPRKNWSSRPTAIYYEPTLSNGTMYVNYQPTDFTETLEIVYRRPYEDFDSAANTPDLPQEWYEAIKWNLALRLAPEYGKTKLIQEIAPLAISSKLAAMNSTGIDLRYVVPTSF